MKIFKKESVRRKAEILQLSPSTLKRLDSKGINTDCPAMVEYAIRNSRVVAPHWRKGNPNRWPYPADPISVIQANAERLCTCEGEFPLCFSCQVHIAYRNHPPMSHSEFVSIRDSVDLA